ncbi:LysM peptidoglycan-binding domain-containing protein [Leifsonia sp. 21MFCrub1.1]|uniref:LysM peptidoglycan-binding domain-containing protein n=1 Tax=Leifsonia sp. 21MFCrub1.1 TaxID=1798223 RepID=UPI000B7D3AC4|nr:LysM domain-containing protein [Leifsonia sp. 21MFCrub1.1]
MHRRAAAAVAAVVLLGALTGCALFAGASPQRPVSQQTHKPTPTPKRTPVGPGTGVLSGSPTPTPSPTTPPPPPPTLVPVPQGTVVAEGNVASPKGSIHFHYRMVSNGDNTYSAQYSNFTSTVPVPISVTLIDVPPNVGDGLTYHGVGDHPLGGPTTAAAPPSSAPLGRIGNPPSLTTLLTYSSAASADGIPVELGPNKILAVNSVRWSIPARQTNVHPVDHGAAPNAQGTVTETTPSGAPASYVVAPGDTTARVAERFGIPVEYLRWLNPSGQAFDSTGAVYESTTLNLDPEAL